MPNNTNRKLIVAQQDLFYHSSILNQIPKDHDIYLFKYDNLLDVRSNSKAIYRNTVLPAFSNGGYSHLSFMAQNKACNVLYELYKDKQIEFGAGVFVNFNFTNSEIDMSQKTKIYSFSTDGKEKRPTHCEAHQSLKTIFHSTRSKRLGKEIAGCLTYGYYQENYLEGTPTRLI